MLPRTILVVFTCLLVLLSSLAFASVVDRSVAIVNDDTITLSEVNELGRSLFKKIAEETPPERLAETLAQARRSVIEKLIEKKLVIQEAKKLNIQVSDQEVDNAFHRVVANNQTTVEQFRKELGAMGVNEQQYREELRDQLLSSKLINHEVRTKVVIPEETVLEYYNTHFTTTVGGGEYHILHIGCMWGGETSATQEEALDKAEKAHKLALQGKNFKELAQQYSDLPSAADGGDLGTFRQDELADYIRDAVVRLKPGEVSPMVTTDNGYHFFKLVTSQEGKVVAHEPYESVKDQIRERMYQQAMEQRFKEWLTSIRTKAYIKIL